MNKKNSSEPAQQPLAKKGKRPPLSQRIHRRKMLAEQRRTEKGQAVTSRG